MLVKSLFAIVIALVLTAAVLLIVVAMQPDQFTVTRTSIIRSSPDAVFARINDFRQWPSWSPWEDLDPAMKRTYTGPESGTGSSYAWLGDDKVGEGRMTITESHAPGHIKIDLEFIKPMASSNITEFTFKPDGENTNVSWTMSGKKNFMMKAFCLIMDIDALIGADFEKGLAKLKTVSESGGAPAKDPTK
ncbi:MAG: SRPBCC family protein [Acidobacteria bacterium]|nr:SRPBCC family protein [Acidobacteriota bacterium]